VKTGNRTRLIVRFLYFAMR